MTSAIHASETGVFTLNRHFNAPRELLFNVFTDPTHMTHWWRPKGFKVIAANMEFTPGGSYHYGLQGPDGSTMWGKMSYREIVAPERLVFINSFSDAEGNLTRHPMSPTWPLELLTRLTFEEQADGTLLTLHWSPLPSATDEERKTFNAAHASMQQGWGGTLDQLSTYLATL